MGRKKKAAEPCAVEGCDRAAKTKGMCAMHYMRVWKNGTTETLTNGRRSHPLYSIWFERKQRGSLCPEWAADIFAMGQVIGERPSATHLLRRVRNGEPYGPDNWQWFAALKRQPGETKKEFWARKWADRRRREPEYEHRRWLKRKYGITPEQYKEMEEAQGGACAICKRPENSVHAATGEVKLLAVDHCHETGRVRGLLCWRCNVVIGKAEDRPDLLRSMAAYLER